MKKTALLIVCLGFPALASATETGPPHRQFFQKYCVACHGPVKPNGDVRLDDPTRVDSAVWEKVYEQLGSQSMPPDNKPQPSNSERRAVLKYALGRAKLNVTVLRAVSDGATFAV